MLDKCKTVHSSISNSQVMSNTRNRHVSVKVENESSHGCSTLVKPKRVNRVKTGAIPCKNPMTEAQAML